jgi:hypothetical protein
MPDSAVTAVPADAPAGVVQRLLGPIRPAYLPVLLTYFAWGASGITGVATLFFQKEALGLTPAEAAKIAFWVGLPWSMKMVVGVASDAYPILGSRRRAYLVLGALAALAGYIVLATTVADKQMYLAVSVLIAVGYQPFCQFWADACNMGQQRRAGQVYVHSNQIDTRFDFTVQAFFE